MKFEGFKFEGGICLQAEGKEFDLHNNFDFTGFTYDVQKANVTLRWIGSESYSSERVVRIEIEFRDVSRLSAKARDAEADVYPQDDCLAEICFVPPNLSMENWGTDEEIARREPSAEDWHCVFSFLSGFLLRVYGESAVARIVTVSPNGLG